MAAAAAGGRPAPTHPTTLAAVQPIPPEVEVDAALAVAVQVACPHGCDLRGLPVEIAAGEDVVAAGELEHHDGTANVSGEIQLHAPRQVGDQSWTVRFPRHATEQAVHEKRELPFRFRTVPHACSLTAWGVPSPAPAGSAQHVKVGVRCGSGCGLGGARVAVCDETGATVGGGILGETPWPDTGALYWAAVEVRAPAAEGVHAWTAVLADAGTDLPHDGAPAAFGFRTGKACEHCAAVRVMDAASRTPVAGVEVRVGPYTTATAADGVATVAVPKGAFEVSIRRDGLEARPFTVTVDGDLALDIEAAVVPKRAELHERAIRDFPWG